MFKRSVSIATSTTRHFRSMYAINRSKLPRVTYSLAELQNTDDTLPMPVVGPVTMQVNDIKAFNQSAYNSQIDLESALSIALLISLGLVQIIATYSIGAWLAR